MILFAVALLGLLIYFGLKYFKTSSGSGMGIAEESIPTSTENVLGNDLLQQINDLPVI